MKAHLVQSAEPLKEGAIVRTVCGVEINKPVFVFMFDGDFGQGLSFNILLCCSRCTGTEESGGIIILPTERYFYGVVEGQESMEAANVQD